MDLLADIAGTAAAALTAVFAWPQAVRALKTGRAVGLSRASTLLMAGSGALWTAYGLATHSVYIALANASVSLAALATLSVFRAWLRTPSGLGWLTLALAAPLLLALAGPAATGTAGVVVAGAMTLPQAFLALRRPGALGAVSPLSYLLLAVNAACWIVYGLAIADPLVVAPNLVTLPSSLWVLSRLRA